MSKQEEETWGGNPLWMEYGDMVVGNIAEGLVLLLLIVYLGTMYVQVYVHAKDTMQSMPLVCSGVP